MGQTLKEKEQVAAQGEADGTRVTFSRQRDVTWSRPVKEAEWVCFSETNENLISSKLHVDNGFYKSSFLL